MSCNVLNEVKIFNLANFIGLCFNSNFNGFNYLGFSVNTRYKYVFDDCKNTGCGPYSPALIANKLYMLNEAAYNSRYKDNEPAAGLDISDLDISDFIIYKPRKVVNCNDVAQPWHFELLKIIQCYIYQVSEDQTRDDDIVKFLKDLEYTLLCFIVTSDDRFKNVSWL